MDKKTFHKLVDKYLDGSASPPEKALLDEYADQLAGMGLATSLSSEEEARLKEEIYRNILKERTAPQHKPVPMYRRPWFRISAAVVILVAAGYLLWVTGPGKHTTQQAGTTREQQIKNDIAPGTNGAVLTLADGSTLVLDSTGNGVVATQGNAKVIKNSDGQISYQVNANDRQPVTGGLTYNTLTTDRGKQFHVKLPDGTDVWLNSASSIRYPTAFAGNEREVEITGEAYFEVAHINLNVKNAKNGQSTQRVPFIVKKGDVSVTVLGTHFNVNAYDDEDALRVTLLEGSVKVSANGVYPGKERTKASAPSAFIKPGQQVEVTRNAQLVTRNNINISDVIAWKNGFFSFRGTDVKGIMRQLSRWYDVEVVYQGTSAGQTFTGKIDRNLTLSQVLKILEETKVHYRIEGNKIIVKE